MRVIIAGSRKFNDYDLLKEILDDFEVETTEITEVVSGTAKGADSLGERYAKENDIPIKRFPAKWNDFSEPCLVKEGKFGEYNALAGPNRNKKMAEHADYAIIFSYGTPGSKNMARCMEDVKKDFRVISLLGEG